MITKLMQIGPSLIAALDKRTEEFGAQMVTFGLFGVINYPLFYILWPHLAPHDYTNFYIRIIATVVCLPLVFAKYWPRSIKRFQSLYWYGALLYCLPFFISFMLMKNFTSPAWLTNVMVGVFILIMLVDWVSAIVLLCVGSVLGVFAYHLTQNPHFYPLEDYTGPVTNYLFAMLIGVIFSRNKEKRQREKLQAMSALGGRVAHELRTPLLSIKASAIGGGRYLPKLYEGYKLAKEAGLDVPELREDRVKLLGTLMSDITDEVNYSNTVIDMLLINVQGRNQARVESSTHNSMSDCLQEALRRFPFASDEERQKISINIKDDFEFVGSRILFIHVLFNLIKNAMYFITQAEKGEIELWVYAGKRSHELHFRDTAVGISPDAVAHLFDLFYSTTPNGTGIGLSFCKTAMVSFGGNIQCRSVLGEYTEFVLTFPHKSHSLNMERIEGYQTQHA